MSVLEDFESVRDAILQHLPRPVTGGVVQVTPRSLIVSEPGVTLGDLLRLLADLGAPSDTLPDALPLDALHLYSLTLEQDPFGEDISLAFSVGLEMAQPVEIVPEVFFDLARIDFSWKAGRFSARATTDMHIHGHAVEATLDLPAQVITASVDRRIGRQLLHEQGLSHDTAKLQRVFVSAHLPLRRAALYVEVEDVFAIGPARLSLLEGDLSLGDSLEDLAGALHAQVTLDIDGHEAVVLDVEAAADKQGWRLAGELAFDELHAPRLAGLLTSAAEALGAPRPALPEMFEQQMIRKLRLAMDTHADRFEAELDLEWQGAADLVLKLVSENGTLQISGAFHVGETVLTIDFERDHGDTLIAVDWHARGGQAINVAEILDALQIDLDALPTQSLSVSTTSLGVVFDAAGNSLMAAEIDAGIDLSKLGDLPLLGTLMPKDLSLGLSLNPYYLSSDFAAEQQPAARGLLSTTHLPETLEDGFHPVVALALGGPPEILDVTPSEPGPPAPAGPPAAHGQATSALSWSDIDKRLGPVHLRRAGYGLETDGGGTLSLALDGDISVAGLTLSLDGLGADYAFESKALTPHLSGLGLELKRGSLEAGAAFLNMEGDFSGALTLAAEKFTLNALAQFKMLDGTPSIFAFGTLDMPLGGPVFFFVEGLAAGLGIHRNLHMPDIEEVHGFPLISAADQAAAGETVDASPMAQLEKLHRYITPQLGQYFVAAGIKFNSFRLLHGNLVAIVQFGKHLEIDLLGVASFSTPPDLPKGTPALAKVSLDLEARLLPEEGTLQVEGRLDKHSYVYSPICHLSGGFAFYAWMGAEHTGDFVLSVGGYNRHWKKRPTHYPHVPRVELKYQISSEVYIKGDAYFALTPSTVMAGGALHVNVQLGKLHAWADLSVDFELGWEPFHYAAWMDIGIGAEYGWFSTHASAHLHIWGPEFSGEAEVSWAVFSFDVQFGPRRPNYAAPISADKFKSSFLGIASQEDADAMLGLTVTEGLKGEIGARQVIQPDGAEIALTTQVPATMVQSGANSTLMSTEVDALGVPPVGLNRAERSSMEVHVHRDGQDVSDEFTLRLTLRHFPAALWGPPLPHPAGKTLPSTKVNKDLGPVKAIGGATLTHKSVPKAGDSDVRQVKDFAYPPHPPEVTRIPWIADSPPPPDAAALRAELAMLGLDLAELDAFASAPEPA